MSTTIFSAKGCIRCTIVKNYLSEHKIAFDEYQIATPEGDAHFKPFYRENRKNIARNADGIFFPVFVQKGTIRQDAASSLAYLIAGESLDAVIEPNSMGHGWTGGINLSSSLPEQTETLVEIVRLLKEGGLNVCIQTNGANPACLETLLQKKYIDRVDFTLLGDADIYMALTPSVSDDDVTESMSLLEKAPALRLLLPIRQLALKSPRCITPEEGARAAKWLAETTGNNKFPLKVKILSDAGYTEEEATVEAFRYRTAARRWQTLTDIAK